MELNVEQRSKEWLTIRRTLVVTASKFADACGLGQGRPYHYFLSRIPRSDKHGDVTVERNGWMRHGVETEPVIDEAYQLLTGNKTLQSGFWIPSVEDPLHGLCGCSPDGKVMGDDGSLLGLVEYKAPVHVLYTAEKHPPCGIPRRYMAQIQGQMGICHLPWCHFMAVCTKTKEISLHHVVFSKTYYQALTHRLLQFCSAMQDWLIFKPKDDDLSSIAAIRQLQGVSLSTDWLPGEEDVTAVNLIERDGQGGYRGPSGVWMTVDFLLGHGSLQLTEHARDIIEKVDTKVESSS